MSRVYSWYFGKFARKNIFTKMTDCFKKIVIKQTAIFLTNLFNLTHHQFKTPTHHNATGMGLISWLF